MLSKQDNEVLCRVGPGTPMGTLMREYWVPVFMSSELDPPIGRHTRTHPRRRPHRLSDDVR